jgi:tetratricopeptide (TPR) repeat protein
MVYFDGITAVLLLNKKDAAFAPLLDDPTLQKAGLDHLEKIREEYAQKSLKKGCRAGNVPELIGAGKIFLALNRPEESEAIFSLLLQGYKGMPGAWIGIGNSQLMMKNFDGAVEALKIATELAPKNLLAWSSYAQACKYAGRPDEERKAIQQALQILQKKKEKMAKKEKKMEEITPVVPEDLPKDSSIQDLVVPE